MMLTGTAYSILNGRHKIISLVLILSAGCLISYSRSNTKGPLKGYTSWLPAPDADHAMLLGNGSMGAMVFGHPHEERIIINHADLYLPLGLPKKPIDQKSHLDEIRQLILQGNGAQAAGIPVKQSIREGYEGQIWSDPYIPAFNIRINTTPGNIEAYKRSLNFETAEAIVEWQQNGRQFERRQFISRSDSLLIIRLTADTVFDVSVSFEQHPVAWDQWDYINNTVKNTNTYSERNMLYYQSNFIHQWVDNIAGYEGVGRLINPYGEIYSSGNTLTAKNTKEILLLVKVASHFTGCQPKTKKTENALNIIPSDYYKLLRRHQDFHTEMFNRVSFELDGPAEDYLLDAEVMTQEAKVRSSTAFIEKQFYAARYHIICATGINPPNLQGIWSSTWTPPWSADYTHDGNLPVAVSSFLPGNTPELLFSYFNYHDANIRYYQDNAERLYGCRGIQIPGHTGSHGWNVHFDSTWCLTFWNGGAAWASHFYYNYWLYTKDMDFLKNRAYPFMKEAALFYQDFLTLDRHGHYMFNPSYSPENNPSNNPSQATINATMDVALARELLRNLIDAGVILQENENQLSSWKNILQKLPDYEVDSTGVFREWLWPGYQENHNHRHVSHLYGMFDMIAPELRSDSILIEGIRNAAEERMKIRRKNSGGQMVFGLVQLAWVAANLGDNKMVEEIIGWLSAHYWSNSLATYHDPGGLFNMDLSGGFQTTVIKSLLYSEPGFISILPAKPDSWKKGSISGLLARNQLYINKLSWEPDQISVLLKSPVQQEFTLQLPENTAKVFISGKLYQTFNNKTGRPLITVKIPSNEITEIILMTNEI